jgi:NADPH:quinone reductase-like Zn-dependent oxidoreductase
MQAYQIERFGGVDGIELRSSDDPRPGLHEVLMRVRASSLNYRDLMVLKCGAAGPSPAGSDCGPPRLTPGGRRSTSATWPR